ncbi:unnamed protein product, partial [Laminaria digitata]
RSKHFRVYQVEYGTQLVKVADLNTTLFRPGRWTSFKGLRFGKQVKTLFMAWLSKDPFERPDHATLSRFLEHVPFWAGAARTVPPRRPSRNVRVNNNSNKGGHG